MKMMSCYFRAKKNKLSINKYWSMYIAMEPHILYLIDRYNV